MSDENNNDNQSQPVQDSAPEQPADRPVFNPEMIIENSQNIIDSTTKIRPSDNTKEGKD